MLINQNLAYFGWGLILAVMPPFYPSEAEKKGATPSQVVLLLLFHYFEQFPLSVFNCICCHCY